MENKINLQEVSKIGDAILTAYVNGDYQEVTQLWCSFGRDTDTKSMAILHHYENPSITDVDMPMVLVETVQKMDAWMGKKLRERRDVEEVDDKLFWVKTIRWENHEETTREAWSESDYSQFLAPDGTFIRFARYDRTYRHEE